MMKESEASHGTRLNALIKSMIMRTSFDTAIRNTKKQAHESWDVAAMTLMQSMVESNPIADALSARAHELGEGR